MPVVTNLRLDRDGDVSHARRAARIAVEALGGNLHDQTRFATAVSEIARNALQYAGGGRVELAVERRGSRTLLFATVSDEGEGIRNIGQVMGGTYSSPEGLGLGIRGAKRISDHFDLDTGTGGTVARIGVRIASSEESPVLARRIADALVDAARRNPVDELTDQNRALRDAFARQAFLQRELHHRTKNNLAIIHAYATMQARNSDSPEVRQALTALAGRVHALGMVHSFLHHADTEGLVDIAQYLRELLQNLDAALVGARADIHCDIEPVPIHPDHAVEIGLIVNELVTNAMKHAETADPAGLRIDIRVRREGNALALSVSDNGRGLADAPRTMRDSRSLGWRVIEASARKLGSAVEADGSNGLTVSFSCPLAAEAATSPE